MVGSEVGQKEGRASLKDALYSLSTTKKIPQRFFSQAQCVSFLFISIICYIGREGIAPVAYSR